MALVSWGFLAFVLAALGAWWLTPARARTPVMAVVSFAFYAFASWRYALLLAALSLGAWFVMRRMAVSPRPRRWLAAGVSATVALLAAFKYSGMAASTADAVLRAAGLAEVAAPEVVAPLGVSFIAFALIHQLVSVHRDEGPAPSLVETAAYLAFFPTVTMGPIKRYPAFLADLREGGAPTGPDDVAAASARVVRGLAKKVLLADLLQRATLPLHQHGGGSAVTLLLAVYAYALFIYFDFSGYSDMAIGIARLFGFRIMENFDRPYLRANLAEFWSAWHISLTRFITEYVFIPLGGSRCGRWRTAFNTLVAMAVSGLWHGAAWNFVAWGLYHGVGLVVVRWWREATGRAKSRNAALAAACERPLVRRAARIAGVAATFHYVAFGWVLFAVTVGDALAIYAAIGRGLLMLTGVR